jgi:rhodanese-related sulfurtransferase
MTGALHEHLIEQGVTLHLGTAAAAFHDDGGRVVVELRDGTNITADLVLLAVGVRPASGLAKAAGLTLGPRGGVAVDRHMRTSDPDIYAAGDMIEVIDTITGEPAVIALAGPANRQGRIVADHICGRDAAYTTTQGTAIVKVFDMTAASTGASEKTLRRTGRSFRKIYVHPNDHAGYYPGAVSMHIKLLFAAEDGRVLGAQIVGTTGVDKRIDVLATAIRAGMTVFDLERLELAYAPPYGSAKDAINMAGFVAANLMRGDVVFWYAEEYPGRTEGATVIDVRNPDEYLAGHLPAAVNIPLPELRERFDEVALLAERGPVLLYCMVGFRSYVAYRILRQRGVEQVATLAGGMQTFIGLHGTAVAH